MELHAAGELLAARAGVAANAVAGRGEVFALIGEVVDLGRHVAGRGRRGLRCCDVRRRLGRPFGRWAGRCRRQRHIGRRGRRRIGGEYDAGHGQGPHRYRNQRGGYEGFGSAFHDGALTLVNVKGEYDGRRGRIPVAFAVAYLFVSSR